MAQRLNCVTPLFYHDYPLPSLLCDLGRTGARRAGAPRRRWANRTKRRAARLLRHYYAEL